MAFIFYFLLLLGFSTISAYDLTRIDSVTGSVQKIEIDKNSNIYAVANGQMIYKLNSKHELIFKKDLYDRIMKILITPSNYAWVITTQCIYLIKPNSTDIDCLTKFTTSANGIFKSVFFIDGYGNLIYNDFEGVAMLKLEATTPTLIVNLENFYIGDNAYLVDTKNDVYLAGILCWQEKRCYNKLAVIQSEELKNIAPSAQFFVRVLDNVFLKSHPSILTEFDDKLIVGFSGNHARLYKINKRNPYEEQILYSQPSSDYSHFHTVENNFYFFGKNKDKNCYLNVGYKNSNESDNVSQISRVFGYNDDNASYNVSQISRKFAEKICSHTKILSDSDGTVFIAHLSGLLYRLNADENKIDDVFPFNETFNSDYDYYGEPTTTYISVELDQKENLWIFGKGDLYVLNRYSTTAKQITTYSFKSNIGVLKINKNTGEVFIGSEKKPEELTKTSDYQDKAGRQEGLYVFVQ